MVTNAFLLVYKQIKPTSSDLSFINGQQSMLLTAKPACWKQRVVQQENLLPFTEAAQPSSELDAPL